MEPVFSERRREGPQMEEISAMAKDRRREIPIQIQMSDRLNRLLKLQCSVMCKFMFVLIILCAHYSIGQCQDVFQSTAEVSQEKRSSNPAVPTPPLSTDYVDRFKSLAQSNVERAKSILGISDIPESDATSKPVYKAEDTKKLLTSLKKEFLTKHAVPAAVSATGYHHIKEMAKQQGKESSDVLKETSTQTKNTINLADYTSPAEEKSPPLKVETTVIPEKSDSPSETRQLALDKRKMKGKEKFIHFISEEVHDHLLAQEDSMKEKYKYEKIIDEDKHLMESKNKEAMVHKPVVEGERPTTFVQPENSDLSEKVENYVKLNVFHKRGALATMEKSVDSINDDNSVGDLKINKGSGAQDNNILNQENGESVNKVSNEEKGISDTHGKNMKEIADGVQPTGTEVTLEQEVLGAFERRRDRLINVTINPRQVIPHKQKKFFTDNQDGNLNLYLNAKEFLTSIPVKNFTLIDKDRTSAVSGTTGKVAEDNVAQQEHTLPYAKPAFTGKHITVNDGTDQVQQDHSEKKEDTSIIDAQKKDSKIFEEKHSEDVREEKNEPQLEETAKEVGISSSTAETIMQEVKLDQPQEIKNEQYLENATHTVEEPMIGTGEINTTKIYIDKIVEHEKEPTDTFKIDAKLGEPLTELLADEQVIEKIKPISETDIELDSNSKPDEELEKDKKKIKDTGKIKKKKEDTLGKPPETDEKSPDTLETYSQFTQRVNAEKKNDVITNGHGGNGHSKGPKVKSKNYASPDCGSKLMIANPEALHSSKVIQSNKDEYMLNKCRDKIWFIIELCESIRPQKFDIANFELFSNLPKDIQVFGSHRYPTRDWTNLSRAVGQEGNRGVQSFPIETEDFFKYIKVEVLSHYGSEFFCPISLFRIYGLSEFEVIDTIEDATDHDENEEAFGDPFEEEEAVKKSKDEGKPGVIPTVLKNMFSGVLDVIKRGYRPSSSASEPGEYCYSLHPKFSVDKSRCSMAESLNYILSCYWAEYEVLMQKPVVSRAVKNSSFCRQLASTMCLEPEVNDSIVYDTVCNNSYVCVMLSPKHVLAMCFMHDNRIMDAEVECDSSSSRLSENFSTTSSDIISPSDDVPSYVKNAKINTSSVTKADEPETNRSVTPDSHGIKPTRDVGGQVTVEQEFQEVNESISLASSESSPTEMPKPPKKSKVSSNGHQNKSIKEVNQDNITETEEKVEVDGSSFGGIELEEVEFSQSDDLTTPPPVPVAQQPVESKISSTSPTNKESVVVRLSNKIKALEYNMSISSQYLEELSRRYKRQMEEMQKQFNLTIAALNATSWQAYQRDQQHQKDIETLEDELASVSSILKQLVKERENLAHTVVEQHVLLMVVEVVVLCVVFTLCNRRNNHNMMINTLREERRAQIPSRDPSDSRVRQDSDCRSSNYQGRSCMRRRSVDSITRERASRQRQRRPSEEALNISGTYQDLLIIEPAIPIMVDSVSDRKRKKKSSNGTLKRSKSNASIVEKSSSSRRSRRLEKLDISSAGVLFCGDKAIGIDAMPPSCLSSPDLPDLPGFSYEPFVNEQDQAVFYSGEDYNSCTARSYITELSLDRQFVNTALPSCDSLHKKGMKLPKSSVCSAPEKLKNGGEKVKKIKKVKKFKNTVNENLHNGLSQSSVGIYGHDYYPKTNGTSYNCQNEQHGEYYYGHTSVHFSDNNLTSHELNCTEDTPYPDNFLNGDSSLVTREYVGNDFMHTSYDKSTSERKKTLSKTKIKVKLRSDNWEWYSTQHFGSSSSETISTCSDSSGKNRKTQAEEEAGSVEKTEERKIKKKKKSKSKASIVLEEEEIPEVDAGT